MARRKWQKGPNQQKPMDKEKMNYSPMLDMSRLTIFRYEAKAIFRDSGIEPNIWTPLLASIVAKASRTGIKEAQDYVIKLDEEGTIPTETGEALYRLLKRFRKTR